MSFLWSIVFVFLVAELCFIVPMLIPGIPSSFWSRILNGQWAQSVSRVFFFVYVVAAAILAMLFLDSLREIAKYSYPTELDIFHSKEDSHLVRLYRAQRNMYLAGFAFFLIPNGRRLAQLIAVPRENVQ